MILNVNAEKTEWSKNIPRYGNTTNDLETFIVDNKIVIEKRDYKYLGFIIDNKLKFESEIKNSYRALR